MSIYDLKEIVAYRPSPSSVPDVLNAIAQSFARTERWRIKATARRCGGCDANVVFAFAWFSNEPLPYAGNASDLRC